MFDFKGKKVYLSGKITGRDRAEVEQEFRKAEEEAKAAGAYFVFNPVEEIEPTVSHELAMRFCIRQLARSNTLTNSGAQPYFDYLMLLPGWQSSPGATLEVAAAKAFGIEIVDVSEDQDD